MKCPADEDGERSSSSEARAEEFASRFLQKHPRFFIYAGVGLGVLIAVILIAASFSGGSH